MITGLVEIFLFLNALEIMSYYRPEVSTSSVTNRLPITNSSDLLFLTCPGSVEFQAVSGSFQTQNPINGKCQPAFNCHKRHNDYSDL